MIEALLGLPLHLRERLAVALEAGVLSTAPSTAALRSVLGSAESVDHVDTVLREFNRLAVPGPACAQWIRSVGASQARLPRADLVWSGPRPAGVHARETRRVYEELIGSATRSVWVSTFAFFDGPRAFDVLATRMDAAPALRATLLLNLQRKRGDVTAATDLVRRFAERFWSVEWPGAARPRVYFDPRALEIERPASVLHAKAVVADDEVVFVTSANLTEAALDRNIELGLLVRDRTLATSVAAHFQGLIDQSLLALLPQT